MKVSKRFFNLLSLSALSIALLLGSASTTPTFAYTQSDVTAAAAVEQTAPANEDALPAADEALDAPVEALGAIDDPAADRISFFSLYGFLWIVALACAVASLVFAVRFFKAMMKADEGNDEMIKIAAAVRKGANAYLKQQYKVVAIFFAVIWCFLMWLAWGVGVQNKIVPWAFLTGGFFSGLAGWFGMKTATWASSRTAAGAQKSLNEGLQVAFRSGAVMGLTVVGLGLLDVVLWFGALYWIFPAFNWTMSLTEITVVMLCFGMGDRKSVV